MMKSLENFPDGLLDQAQVFSTHSNAAAIRAAAIKNEPRISRRIARIYWKIEGVIDGRWMNYAAQLYVLYVIRSGEIIAEP
jgi:hypothetical protein